MRPEVTRLCVKRRRSTQTIYNSLIWRLGSYTWLGRLRIFFSDSKLNQSFNNRVSQTFSKMSLSRKEGKSAGEGKTMSNRKSWNREARIKARVVARSDTRADLRAKPIHLTLNPLKRPGPIPRARNAVEGFVLGQKSDKYATICRRMEAKYSRPPSSHPCPSSFSRTIPLSSLPPSVLPSPGEGGEQRVTLKLLRPNKT